MAWLFNRDASLSFEVHVVEHLVFHVFPYDRVGAFEKTVGKGGFAMVDVCYYAEISYIFHLLFISECKIRGKS